VTESFRAGVAKNPPVAELRAIAEADGMTALRAGAWAKACEGVTTVDEVLRATRDEVLG
jgi:type IV pilus assembly protein PilB